MKEALSTKKNKYENGQTKKILADKGGLELVYTMLSFDYPRPLIYR